MGHTTQERSGTELIQQLELFNTITDFINQVSYPIRPQLLPFPGKPFLALLTAIMLYESTSSNYRTSSNLIGGHSRIVNKASGPARRLSPQLLHSTRSVPQFTLKHSSGIGTTHSRSVLTCNERGGITKEMVKSHWNTKQIEDGKFDDPGIVTNAELRRSTVKPQTIEITRDMTTQLGRVAHAGVSTAFADPVQRLQHHQIVDTSVKLDKHVSEKWTFTLDLNSTPYCAHSG